MRTFKAADFPDTFAGPANRTPGTKPGTVISPYQAHWPVARMISLQHDDVEAAAYAAAKHVFGLDHREFESLRSFLRRTKDSWFNRSDIE